MNMVVLFRLISSLNSSFWELNECLTLKALIFFIKTLEAKLFPIHLNTYDK